MIIANFTIKTLNYRIKLAYSGCVHANQIILSKNRQDIMQYCSQYGPRVKSDLWTGRHMPCTKWRPLSWQLPGTPDYIGLMYCPDCRQTPGTIMISWHGHTFRITGTLCWKSTDYPWIMNTKGKGHRTLMTSCYISLNTTHGRLHDVIPMVSVYQL